MNRLLLAAAATFLAAAARAQSLDCKSIDRNHPEPSSADFSAWKWHTTTLASKRTQCYLKDHAELLAVQFDAGHGLLDKAIDDSQTLFETHRDEFSGLEAGARRAALKRWKEEALAAVRTLLGQKEETSHAAQEVKQKEKKTLQHGLRTLADGEYASDEPVVRPEPSAPAAEAPKPAGAKAWVDDEGNAKYNTTVTVDRRAAYAPLYEQFGRQYGVEPAVIKAVCRTESDEKYDAVSPKGATGVCQFMPATAKALNLDPTNPVASIEGAAKVLRENLNYFGNYTDAVAAYNAGWKRVIDAGGVPPIKETQSYVKQIIGKVGADVWSRLPTFPRKVRRSA